MDSASEARTEAEPGSKLTVTCAPPPGVSEARALCSRQRGQRPRGEPGGRSSPQLGQVIRSGIVGPPVVEVEGVVTLLVGNRSRKLTPRPRSYPRQAPEGIGPAP